MKTPDVLVLGAGGILGEAWISSLLAGLEGEEFAARECRTYVGTSAGSIVAAMLCAGIDPGSRLGRLPEQPEIDGAEHSSANSIGARAARVGAAAGAVAMGPFASAALRGTAPGGRLLRRAALGRVPRGWRSLAGLGREIERAGASWDGRLRVCTVELETGRRVVFGAPGAPDVSVSQAVQASCAIPGVFRPVAVDGRSYVDGGAWSLTNMDVVEAGRGIRVLCLNPTGSLRPSARSPFGGLGILSRSVAGVEAAALRGRGAEVTVVSPDRGSVAAMGGNLMNARPRQQVIAAGLAQGRRIGAAGAA